MKPTLTEGACWRCLALALGGRLRMETVQRLPAGSWAPLSRARPMRPQCYDCASAELLQDRFALTFEMARIAVANERQEQYRLPGAPMGLAQAGYVRSSAPGAFAEQLAWLERNGWFQQSTRHEPKGILRAGRGADRRARGPVQDLRVGSA